MTQTPSRDWQKEAKVYKQSYEATLTAWEAEKARADVAEAKSDELFTLVEQQGKEIKRLQDLINTMSGREQHILEDTLQGIKQYISTLYPDTPAPKEGK